MLKIIRRVFSFADWSRTHPREPHPGDMIDAQFDEIIDRVDALDATYRQATAQLAAAPRDSEWVNAKNRENEANNNAMLWAEVAEDWAEYMPDTIPPNTLAWMGITGDHWSARWWANRADNAFGRLTDLYLGIHSEPPLTNLEGGVIVPGSIYYDSDSHQMYVWTGTNWEPLWSPQRSLMATLFYIADPGQTTIDIKWPDIDGESYVLDPLIPEAVDLHVNGLRLTQIGAGGVGGYSVDVNNSVLTLTTPLAAGDKILVDILMSESRAANGKVEVFSLKPLTFDGVATVYTLETKAFADPVSVTKSEELVVSLDGVVQEAGVDYTAIGDQITFAVAPNADVRNFITMFQAAGTAAVDWAAIANKPATFPPTLPIPISGVTNLQATLDGKAPTVHSHTTAQVTGLDTALANKQAADPTLAALAVLDASAGLVEQTGADIFAKRAIGVATTTSIPSRADADARYAATSHTHTTSQVTGLDTALAGKSNTGHGHTTAEVSGLDAALAAKAPLASPALTGTPTAPTATAGTNTTQIASTAFVASAVTAAGGVLPSNAAPFADNIAAPGTSALYSRGDHVHPTDTSRAPTVHTHSTAQITDWATATGSFVTKTMFNIVADTAEVYATNLTLKPAAGATATVSFLWFYDKVGVSRGYVAAELGDPAGKLTLSARNSAGGTDCTMSLDINGINAGNNKIRNLGAPTVPTDAATRGYVDTNFAPKDAPTFTNGITVGGASTFNAIINGTAFVGTGNVQASSIYADAGFFRTSALNVYLGTGGAGNVYLRPNGAGTVVGQVSIDSNGTVRTSADLQVSDGGTFGPTSASISTANPGIVIGSSGYIYSKRSGTALQTHLYFTNNAAVAPATVGSIETTGSTTNFKTSSDELLKDFTGPLDPQRAIDIIRADPAREFDWKNGDGHAVGWGAQTSYAISPDLASPPAPSDEIVVSGTAAPKAGEPGYIPWGMDLSKRTPYLWAALTAALDKIDQLEARLAALEGAT